MRIFLAGASGVIGRRLVPLLRVAGHEVAGLTRTRENAAVIEELGASPVVCDVYDAAALTRAVAEFQPDVMLHELTDLPDDAAQIEEFRERHARIRIEGTHNLLAAARAAATQRVLAQSVAWPMPAGPGHDSVAELERSVLAARGVVLRYGQFYGEGTYHPDTVPAEPRIQIDRAAEQTVDALTEPAGVLELTDEGTRRLAASTD
ncbi:NAD-dependent epimerase/dehydratase family protein [Microbacterium horticulturae]|uniref:NAD-dependent epimerase/dehydratase family protein n=1 Tax=Microbacterium horticulturae TaxID=3028316 RepID=A0ABY8C2K8_9MICO|nr:NAD-dependent epimerase/dehydratase family protein [Microbacterium sp. KACC 23027]WEG08853.1 NAD-dependent epimerase/dehydratase family protein [Microbacterium sp. KACC 23027]